LKKKQISIDGPAGSGKSTIAKLLAEKLNFVYIDTGAMYRAVTLLAIKNSISMDNIAELSALAEKAKIDFANEKGKPQLIFCDGENITEEIRSSEVNEKVSTISAIKEVREKLIHNQRRIAENKNVVMDGRDIGTVVLPDATIKIFLTASLEERSKRRAEEMKSKGVQFDFHNLKEEIARRDKMDSERTLSPLKPAQDAIIIDSTELTIKEVTEKILQLYYANGGE